MAEQGAGRTVCASRTSTGPVVTSGQRWCY